MRRQAPGVEQAEARHAPRARMPEAERRQDLVEVAQEVFLRQGYAAANMDDVARGAGMSKKTLYQLFPSKEALFEAVIASNCAPLAAMAQEESEATAEALMVLLERAAHHILAPRQIGMCRLVTSTVHRVPDLADMFHRAGAMRGKVWLEDWIAARVREGRLDPVDPAEAAPMLMGMVLSEMHIKLLLGLRGPPSDEEIRRRIRLAVEIFLRGAGWSERQAAAQPAA